MVAMTSSPRQDSLKRFINRSPPAPVRLSVFGAVDKTLIDDDPTQRRGAPGSSTKAVGIGTIWHVLGVVSAYITQAIAVTGGAGVVPTNYGIVVVYDIKHAIDAIDGFVD